jgi:hypothetical protein
MQHTTHLKKINCILQSRFAIIEQGTDFALTKESLDFGALLLGFKKGVYFMESPGW